ncbi:hypothetical protein ACJX0J_005561, partial [Zea mays]
FHLIARSVEAIPEESLSIYQYYFVENTIDLQMWMMQPSNAVEMQQGLKLGQEASEKNSLVNYSGEHFLLLGLVLGPSAGLYVRINYRHFTVQAQICSCFLDFACLLYMFSMTI